ncbi:MAG TPA: peptidylprolyl isomerase [Polyangiaceae bacterium]|nr:peptidylprolyl isomerase [Polyangiaceae bacterium]
MAKFRSLLGFSLMALSACRSGAPPEPESRRAPAPTPVPPAPPKPVETAKPEPRRPPDTPPGMEKPVAEVPVSPGDPLAGKFSLADATAGLPPGNKLVATMKTDKGTLECELYADKAPITVANFVGLARGLRPWKNPAGEWVKKPLYDGTPFHRIIPGFMIQGGDPRGNGSGDPGYVIPDEVWTGAHHDTRGQICMANRGPNTNGSQFFIMDGAASHLDSGYTIFGKCSPDSVIQAIAATKTQGDRAIDPPKIQSVTVKRVKG